MGFKNLLLTSLLVVSLPSFLLAQGAGQAQPVENSYTVVENDLVEVEGEIEALIEDGTLEKDSKESQSVVSLLSEIQDLLIEGNVDIDTSKLDDLKESIGSGGVIGSTSGSSGTVASDGSVPVRPKYYVVKKREPLTDCLWRIAGYSFIYNNPSRWTLIFEANRGIIKDADLIYPGQVIEIPSSDGEERSGTYDN